MQGRRIRRLSIFRNMENLLIWKFLLDWRRDTEAKPNPNGGLELVGRDFGQTGHLGEHDGSAGL